MVLQKGLSVPADLSFDVRTRCSHGPHKVVEGLTGEFELEFDRFRFYMLRLEGKDAEV